MSRRPAPERPGRSRPVLAALTLGPALGLLASCGDAAQPAGDAVADTPRPTDAPHLVVLVLDTLRADVLSSYGHPDDPSPALAGLARDGVVFESVLSQTSWTLPSVGSLLTSRYPRTLGLYREGDQALPLDVVTLAEHLDAAGYATFGATANPHLNSRLNFAQGFDEYVDSTVVWSRPEDEIGEDQVLFTEAPLHRAGELLAEARSFAERQEAVAPVYLQVDLMEVHEYGREGMLRPEYASGFEDSRATDYLRHVRQLTDDVAAFVEDMRARPGWEDALFCITSDHGEGLTDHPDVERSTLHGTLLYPSMTRVPWIVVGGPAWRPARRRVAQDVRLLDVVPTLLDLAGLPPLPGATGVSLAPVVRGEADEAPLPEVFVTETSFRQLHKISAVDPDWQYVHNRAEHDGVPTFELQERGQTPDGELTDRAGSRPDVLLRLRDFVLAWEERFPRQPATPPAGDGSSDAEIRQLEAIGYAR